MAGTMKRFLLWREKHLSERDFMIILSLLVGLAVGLAAVIIKNSVHAIQQLLHTIVEDRSGTYLYVVLPAFGILVVLLFTRYVVRRPVRHGVPNVLYAIGKNNGLMNKHNMFSSVITSAFTVGFGGSVGLEGPTVSTGAAIGSNVGRVFHLNYKQVVLLLGCACAGAMSAIFKAPIAAIVFALEVIMLDLTMASIVPLLVASSTAALTSYLFMGQRAIYSFAMVEGFDMNELPMFLVLGVVTGLMGVYFTRSYMFIERHAEKIGNPFKRLLIGAGLLGIIIFVFPSLYGEGYEITNACLSGDNSFLFDHTLFSGLKDQLWAVFALSLLVILFKVVAASLTFGAGGVGGIFAPTLFMGANLGLLFALGVNQMGFGELTTNNFALVGMAGMIASVLHAPLTAIFLIGDLTGGYELLFPLMITSTISYVTVKNFEANSVYTIQLASRKELITHHKDKALLTRMTVEELLETNFFTIHPDATLGELVEVIEKSPRNVFPVVKDNNELVGILTMNDIRHIMFKHDQYEKVFVRELMYWPEDWISLTDTMEEVAQRIQDTGRFNIPVLKDGKYMGCVSRANVFSKYRELLKEASDH